MYRHVLDRGADCRRHKEIEWLNRWSDHIVFVLFFLPYFDFFSRKFFQLQFFDVSTVATLFGRLSRSRSADDNFDLAELARISLRFVQAGHGRNSWLSFKCANERSLFTRKTCGAWKLSSRAVCFGCSNTRFDMITSTSIDLRTDTDRVKPSVFLLANAFLRATDAWRRCRSTSDQCLFLLLHMDTGCQRKRTLFNRQTERKKKELNWTRTFLSDVPKCSHRELWQNDHRPPIPSSERNWHSMAKISPKIEQNVLRWYRREFVQSVNYSKKIHPVWEILRWTFRNCLPAIFGNVHRLSDWFVDNLKRERERECIRCSFILIVPSSCSIDVRWFSTIEWYGGWSVFVAFANK